MARLQFTTPSGTHDYEIVDEFVTIGSAVGNHLRLRDPAVAPVHLRVIHAGGGYRLEVADAELMARVNGADCATHSLSANDQIEIGDTTLTFVDETQLPPPAHDEPSEVAEEVEEVAEPAEPVRRHRSHGTAHDHHRQAPAATRHHHAERAHHHPERPHHHHKAKPKTAPWVIWAWVGALAIVVPLALKPLFGAGSYYSEESPEHWLSVAEKQLAEGSLTRALDSCQTAEMRKPDYNTQQKIKDLRARIEERRTRDRDQTSLDSAKNALQAMEKFEQTHLAGAQPRAAVRELARSAQTWLRNYADIVRRYPDRSGDVTRVQSILDRFAAKAQLERPDDSTDVLWAVNRRLTLERPLYGDALAMIDGYVSTHPNDPAIAELKNRRAAIVTTARADFDRHEAEARRLLAAGRAADARKEVQAMRDAIVVNAWGAQADALEREIDRAAK